MTRCSLARVRITDSDVLISRIAFGCARIFGGREARASARLIETALDVGIRHFDTAPSYSQGQSEELLGCVLAGVSDVTIATKVGVARGEPQSRRFAVIYRRTLRPTLARLPGLKSRLLELLASRHQEREDDPRRRVLLEEEILRVLEESLERLKRTRVDLFLVHEPDRFVLSHEARHVFCELKQQGIIGAFGLGWDRAVALPQSFGQVVQSRYDPEASGILASNETRIFHGVLRHAKKNRTGGVTHSPADRIQRVLESFPASSVVFSASSPAQIRDIVQRCGSAKVDRQQ